MNAMDEATLVTVDQLQTLPPGLYVVSAPDAATGILTPVTKTFEGGVFDIRSTQFIGGTATLFARVTDPATQLLPTEVALDAPIEIRPDGKAIIMQYVLTEDAVGAPLES